MKITLTDILIAIIGLLIMAVIIVFVPDKPKTCTYNITYVDLKTEQVKDIEIDAPCQEWNDSDTIRLIRK